MGRLLDLRLQAVVEIVVDLFGEFLVVEPSVSPTVDF